MCMQLVEEEIEGWLHLFHALLLTVKLFRCDIFCFFTSFTNGEGHQQDKCAVLIQNFSCQTSRQCVGLILLCCRNSAYIQISFYPSPFGRPEQPSLKNIMWLGTPLQLSQSCWMLCNESNTGVDCHILSVLQRK